VLGDVLADGRGVPAGDQRARHCHPPARDRCRELAIPRQRQGPVQDGLPGTGDQYLGHQDTGRGLEGCGPAEGPPLRRSNGGAPPRFSARSSSESRSREPAPAAPPKALRAVRPRGAAKLVKIRSFGKPGHNVSSAPGLAFRRGKKTILPGKARCHIDDGGGLSPAREPGGTLQRLTRSLSDAAWPVAFTTELATDADLPVMVAAASRPRHAR
jgi:hypothetical protein